jgi:hypothetical protein
MATVSSLAQPTTAREQYYHGFDLRVAEVFHGVRVDLAALSHHERRGYDAAVRAQADADTAGYLSLQAEVAAMHADLDRLQAQPASWQRTVDDVLDGPIFNAYGDVVR